MLAFLNLNKRIFTRDLLYVYIRIHMYRNVN